MEGGERGLADLGDGPVAVRVRGRREGKKPAGEVKGEGEWLGEPRGFA